MTAAALPDTGTRRMSDGEHDAAERAAAHRFWQPNYVWRSVGEFASFDDMLNLRTVNAEIHAQADAAITTLRIGRKHVAAFLRSTGFKDIRTLSVRNAHVDTLHLLAADLAAHPRRGLTLRLEGHLRIDADSAARFVPLALAKWVVAPSHAHPWRGVGADVVNVLAGCAFPVELEAGLSRDAWQAASRIATLERLSVSSRACDDATAAMFSSHLALRALFLAKGPALSSQGIAAFAAIPTLRAFCMQTLDEAVFDDVAARALAANPALETLELEGDWRLPDEGLAALAHMRTLTTLSVPAQTDLSWLAGMTYLRHLTLRQNHSGQSFTMNVKASNSIAAMPALQSLVLDANLFQKGAMKAILEAGRASSIVLTQFHIFDAEEIAAVLGNTRLRELELRRGARYSVDVFAALSGHPTLERLRILYVEHRRPPGQSAWTAHADEA